MEQAFVLMEDYRRHPPLKTSAVQRAAERWHPQAS